MEWKELLAKLKLIDITPKVEGKQVGGINVNVEDNSDHRTYNFHFHSAEAVQAFVAGDLKISPEFEKRVKEEAERRLINLGISPDVLSEPTRTEIVLATTAISTIQLTAREPMDRAEIIVKVSPESKEPGE